MKKLIFAVAAILAATVAFAYDDTSFSPKGNLSSYTKTEFSVTSKFGEYYRTPVLKHVHVYDADGYETSVSSYNAKDALLDKTSFKYTSSLDLSQVAFTDSDGSVVWTESYFYNSDGTVEHMDRNDASGYLQGRTIYKYDENKVVEDVYAGDGSLISKTIYNKVMVADSSRNGEVIVYNADGSLNQKTVYTYLESGLVSQVEVLDASGNSTGKTLYKYNANVLKEIQDYDMMGVLVQRTIYKMDAKGNPTSINTYAVAEKFGETVNEITGIETYVYKYKTADGVPEK